MTLKAPQLSLVLGTCGRVRELAEFLDSLGQQPCDRLELIIVDQNEDDRVAYLLKSRECDVAVRHLRVPWRGISRARNFGAAQADGAILAFPDDDCSYPAGLVAGVVDWLERHPEADGLSCRVTDDRGRRSAGGFMSHGSHWLARRNVWRSAVSPGIFVRRALHEKLEGFDERLGAGAGTAWGSAEDTDYLLRALEHGARVFYAADRIVHHPQTIGRGPRLQRGWSYGRGMGFALRRHGFGLGSALYFASLSLGAACWSGLTLELGPAVARAAMGAGRVAGWFQAKRVLAGNAAAPASPGRQALRTISS